MLLLIESPLVVISGAMTLAAALKADQVMDVPGMISCALLLQTHLRIR
jgi:hypothetical protein